MSCRRLRLFCATAVGICTLASASAARAAFDSAQKPEHADVTVLRVVPEGDQVPSPVRQIVISFDRVMVPIGDMSVAPDKAP
ncbi:MAG TPA: hypothetical protein VMT49_07810, partial [Steroidobacteraceae bacterium]|nr:hypothetical protein [Steroidobacteraceae bacterium]